MQRNSKPKRSKKMKKRGSSQVPSDSSSGNEDQTVSKVSVVMIQIAVLNKEYNTFNLLPLSDHDENLCFLSLHFGNFGHSCVVAILGSLQ